MSQSFQQLFYTYIVLDSPSCLWSSGEKQMTMAGTLFGRTLQSLLTVTSQVQTCVRTHYVDWKMLRDVKRRQSVKQFNVSRQRLNAIRKNTILPRELQASERSNEGQSLISIVHRMGSLVFNSVVTECEENKQFVSKELMHKTPTLSEWLIS